MKSNLIMGLLFFVSSTALASQPVVGDSALYKTTYTEGTTFGSNTWKKTVLELKHGSRWLSWARVRWETDSTLGSTEESWVAVGALNYLDSTEKFCERMLEVAKEAELVKVTVPAGTFDSCKVTPFHAEEQTWYSEKVPFGVLKRIVMFSDGAKSEEVLLNFE